MLPKSSNLFCGLEALLASSFLVCCPSVANSSEYSPIFVQKKVFLLSGFLRTNQMGLSNFPSAAEGVLPVLVMNTVLSVALLKNMVRSVLQLMGAAWSNNSSNLEEETEAYTITQENARERRISITHFKSLCNNRSSSSISRSNSINAGLATVECCVCLNGFEADEEVSELSCKHFFHKGCLDKWFDNKHATCPLCRSIL